MRRSVAPVVVCLLIVISGCNGLLGGDAGQREPFEVRDSPTPTPTPDPVEALAAGTIEWNGTTIDRLFEGHRELVVDESFRYDESIVYRNLDGEVVRRINETGRVTGAADTYYRRISVLGPNGSAVLTEERWRNGTTLFERQSSDGIVSFQSRAASGTPVPREYLGISLLGNYLRADVRPTVTQVDRSDEGLARYRVRVEGLDDTDAVRTPITSDYDGNTTVTIVVDERGLLRRISVRGPQQLGGEWFVVDREIRYTLGTGPAVPPGWLDQARRETGAVVDRPEGNGTESGG